jgi:hypothetical protein
MMEGGHKGSEANEGIVPFIPPVEVATHVGSSVVAGSGEITVPDSEEASGREQQRPEAGVEPPAQRSGGDLETSGITTNILHKLDIADEAGAKAALVTDPVAIREQKWIRALALGNVAHAISAAAAHGGTVDLGANTEKVVDALATHLIEQGDRHDITSNTRHEYTKEMRKVARAVARIHPGGSDGAAEYIAARSHALSAVAGDEHNWTNVLDAVSRGCGVGYDRALDLLRRQLGQPEA